MLKAFVAPIDLLDKEFIHVFLAFLCSSKTLKQCFIVIGEFRVPVFFLIQAAHCGAFECLPCRTSNLSLVRKLLVACKGFSNKFATCIVNEIIAQV